MAATYGNAAPTSVTYNYDALVATTISNYRETLSDNVSTSNSFFAKIKWESEDGGLNVVEDLMYGLAPTQVYEGYDELALTPTNGITQVNFDWAQAATPISISEKERKQNKKRIVPLLKSKITQAEIGMKEFWPKKFLRGNRSEDDTTGNLVDNYVDTSTGSSFVDPLPKLVAYDPTASMLVGNLNQSTYSWWRNQTKESAASTTGAFIDEIINMYNTCSKGPMGKPNLILCDQVTWELVHKSWRAYFQNTMTSFNDIPWPNLNFWGTPLIWDEFVPDVYSNKLATSGVGTYGTMYFLNTQTFKCKYESETNFVPTEFQRPVNQDAKFKHILWMGTVTINNRRKNGVIGKIARSLT